MCNHTAVANAFITAACSLAVALLTSGMGVNSAWAGLDQPSGLKFTPLSSAHHNPLARNYLVTQACSHQNEGCSKPGDPGPVVPCCAGLKCVVFATGGWRCTR